MGMDLYKMKFKPSESDHYNIGKTHIQLENIVTQSVFEPDTNFVHNCIKKALAKHSIDYQQSHGKFCYDFTNGNAHIGIYTEDTVKEFERLDAFIDDSYGYDGRAKDEEARQKAYKDYDDYGALVANDEKYWKDKMIFSDIPIVTTYKVLGSHEEINYARKPFRDIKDKHIQSYKIIIANAKGDSENSFVIFDHETEYDFKQLIKMIDNEDMIEHLNSMLPIKEDELICIDW